MNLHQKQTTFSLLVARLIDKADSMGFEVTLGEAFRNWSEKPSCHPYRLAIDINLFRDGEYLSDTESHKELGKWWKGQSTEDYECCWGGEFRNHEGEPSPDGNHYSITHNGIK